LSAPSPAKTGVLLVVALVLALLCGATGYLLDGSTAALGGACGALVAAGYSWSFLRSHLARTSRGAGLDATIAGGAMTRLVVAGGFGIAMWMTGRPAVMAYLLAFGAAFLVLAAPQVVKVIKQVRTRPAAPAASSAVETGGETV
jgi:hypothetical protein